MTIGGAGDGVGMDFTGLELQKLLDIGRFLQLHPRRTNSIMQQHQFSFAYNKLAERNGKNCFCRCRFTGRRDSLDHCTGEGSLVYTNGDRFEVQTKVVFIFR